MLEGQLHLSQYLPAAGATATTLSMDLEVSGDSYGNQWRNGRIRMGFPALPNHTNSAYSITVAMQVQPAAGGAFAATVPGITASIAGVASTGSAAATIDFPLPPANLTGPINFLITVPAGDGNNTGGLVTFDWVNE
jgi:hypothetical protein